MFVRRNLTDFVETRAGSLYFEKSGKGFPLVLLHPLGMSTWVWEAIRGGLSEQFTVYAFDMLGHGKSDKPKHEFSISDYAESLDDACQVLNIHRAHFIGNSVGACLAIEMASRYPDRVDKLVLVGCPVWNISESEERIKAFQFDFDDAGLPKPRTLQELKEKSTFANPTEQLLLSVNQSRLQAGIWVKNLSTALAYYDVYSKLNLVNASKTLILYGEADRLLPAAPILKHNIIRSLSITIPGVGHVPQVENPGTFTNILNEFLQ